MTPAPFVSSKSLTFGMTVPAGDHVDLTGILDDGRRVAWVIKQIDVSGTPGDKLTVSWTDVDGASSVSCELGSPADTALLQVLPVTFATFFGDSVRFASDGDQMKLYLQVEASVLPP